MKEGYLFEEFGFTYYGPINGHDYDEMISYLEMAKKSNRPVLLHVITEKGKGYKYAESDIEGIWHGISPFDKETGIIKSKNDGLISWSEVMSNHLIDIAKTNKDIIAITPAMANGSKLNKFKEIYKDRFIDVGIAEEHALVMANSMAIAGKKPFVLIAVYICCFITRSSALGPFNSFKTSFIPREINIEFSRSDSLPFLSPAVT